MKPDTFQLLQGHTSLASNRDFHQHIGACGMPQQLLRLVRAQLHETASQAAKARPKKLGSAHAERLFGLAQHLWSGCWVSVNA